MAGASLDDLLAAVDAGPVVAHGITHPVAALAAARLARSHGAGAAMAGGPGRPAGPVVVVTPDDAGARRIAEDVAFFLPGARAGAAAGAGDPATPPPALHVPALDTSPYAELAPERQSLLGRMAALVRLARGGALLGPVVVASAPALLRRVIPRDALLARTAVLAAAGELDRDATAALLLRAGYARTPVVEDPGTFAVRGGVLDVFSPLYRYPVRIELFGDAVESMRLFDPDSQRTLRELDELWVHPVRETIVTSGGGGNGGGDGGDGGGGRGGSAAVRRRILAAADAAHHPSAATRRVLERIEAGDEFVGMETLTPAFHDRMEPLWQYLDGAARWLILDPDAIARAVGDELEIAAARYQERLDSGSLAFPPEDHYVSAEELSAALRAPHHRIEARSLEVYEAAAGAGAGNEDREADPGASGARALRLAVDDNGLLRASLERARRQHADELMKPLVEAIASWRTEGWRVAVAAGSLARARQLTGLLADYGSPAEVSEAEGLSIEALWASESESESGSESESESGSASASASGRPTASVAWQLAAPTASASARLTPGAPPLVLAGDLGAGFALAADRLVLLTADEIFGPRRRSSARQRAAAKRARAALRGGSADFSQLSPGDYLVHDLHGVGLYKGLAKLPVSSSGPAIDFLHLEYSGGQLYLPVYRMGEVQRYVGAEGHAVRVDKLGGVTWQKARGKASTQVKALAEELLKLYAQRAALPGHGFPPADSMFHEFEATFPFEETPDQQRAIEEVLADMESQRPMDRLVCGDVGYGKTEVALRACFKAVMGGKQAALLAPTTVLVEQHYQTMRARYAGWPVNVARLSRFQSRAEQLETIKGLAAGTIDVVVGTHRLLSKDVRFKEMGLLVIDEEQRFGVTHKERLKRVRTQMDVLTLTATPIPRTLHLAMSGLRDLSIIATPPADRRSIRTFVARPDDGVLREGIRRELGRGGQVFFVCPRIGTSTGRTANPASALGPANVRRGGRGTRSLEEWADHLRALVPEARVAVAHGQMSPEELERIMVGFVDGDSDILVSTTIVESGLDIPRANTMFVDQADSFGLAQLYQLRGRIGRSSERAFCYLLVPPPEKLSSEARRRLETLQRFTELGAGFQIASHDLEIRGGGELLGARQSGAIAAVGFETYIAMLEEAVAEMRGDGTLVRPRDPELNVDVPGYIPDDYVPDTGQRLDLYKRLSAADDEDEVKLLLDEIADRYGSPPPEVHTLADLMVLKVHARTLRAQTLELTAGRMSLALAPDTPLDPAKLAALVGTRGGRRYRLTPDMRIQRSFTADEARQVTASARRCLLDLIACGRS